MYHNDHGIFSVDQLDSCIFHISAVDIKFISPENFPSFLTISLVSFKKLYLFLNLKLFLHFPMENPNISYTCHSLSLLTTILFIKFQIASRELVLSSRSLRLECVVHSSMICLPLSPYPSYIPILSTTKPFAVLINKTMLVIEIGKSSL